MSNSPIHAFLVGRILAEELGAAVEKTLTNSLSAVGKFDAEQRENLRQLSERVMERVERVEAETGTPTSAVSVSTAVSTDSDLQALVDNLRAEIAQLRSELQRYRNETTRSGE
ncbi:MAG: hypothetical protein J7641_22035 [Cyanobacteria bacterium SID2]|nr:hypothetical protein [Cyanobacteria bacterium SID2]MBP0004539.1 hypothetical protein [Cyanobacteria bacterium SBC]